jgi:hypothetical protein
MKLLRFFEFILEKSEEILLPVYFSKSFIEKIKQINSPIVKKILSEYFGVTPKLGKHCFISYGKSNDTIEYTDSSKLFNLFKKINPQITTLKEAESSMKMAKSMADAKIDYYIWTENRTEIKIGRFIKKLFDNQFSDSEIESFVNQWKSMDEGYSFEIWTGNKLLEGYMTDNYSPMMTSSNPLINSCMNGRLDLISFYKHCKVELLVLLGKNNLISGRALLWIDHKGEKIMDRVYYIDDKDYFKFIKYANENGIYYKKQNISGESTFIKNGQEVELDTKVEIIDPDTVGYKGIPYMDTFKYSKGKWAYNVRPKTYPYLELISTDGEFARIYSQFDIN